MGYEIITTEEPTTILRVEFLDSTPKEKRNKLYRYAKKLFDENNVISIDVSNGIYKKQYLKEVE